jgi:type I restriction enzyme S subunit
MHFGSTKGYPTETCLYMNEETITGEGKNVLLGDVCRVQGGFAFKSQDYVNNPDAVPLIRIGDLQNGQVSVGNRTVKIPVSFLKDETLHRYLLRDGDVLIAMTGATTGKLARYRQSGSAHAFLNQRVGRILPRNEDVILDFIFFAGQTTQFQQQIVENILAAAQGNISPSKLESLRLLLPDIREQRRIAVVLGLVQRAIGQQERLIALTTELKKALLHTLFTDGLRGEPQKETEIGPVPESWEILPLGSLAKVGNGSTPKRNKAEYWQGGTIPWLNSTKIHDRFITDADQFVTELAVKKCHLPRVNPGGLLVAITGQGKTLGNSALVLFETCINQHLAYAQFSTAEVLPEFVLWFMQTRYEHLRSISQAGGSTKGALTCGYLKTYPIPVPSLDEQREIASTFKVLDQKEKLHVRQKRSLGDLFRSLLHHLMTAQIRVDGFDLQNLHCLNKD